MATQPTIIFDLDGTLADTIHDLVPSINRVIERQNLKPVTIQQIGPTSGKGIKAMLELAYTINDEPLPPQLLSELVDEFMEDYWHNICVDTVMYEETEAVLNQFRASNWLLGVCTNKPIDMAEKLLHELAIKPLFSSITGANSFEFRKPDPRHLLKTVELTGGTAERAIMIGDSQTDILTAQNAGIPVVAVDFGYSDQPVATFNPDIVISHYSQLFAAVTTLVR
ncbi:MAG: HAD-IA family hydrolase [Hyphomicrobiales bacterium]|nr:HAD-IA family hydrolase [Hyphomicrobiales bacterium]